MNSRMHNFDQFSATYDRKAQMTPPRPYRPRSSHIGLGIFGILMLIPVFYVLSVLWWSLWLMIGVHASGAETWSYLYTCTHWGALVPFVVG